MKTLKKLFSVSAIVALLGTLVPMYAFGANYSDELTEAYAYAYSNGITTMKTIDAADMFGSLTRVAMAKMIANYATTVLGLEPDTSAKCEFTDVTAALDAQYDNGVTNACQLGLMGQNITAFRPNDLVTRAEFGTTLSRALNANSDDLASMNAANPYYKDHLNFLKSEGIMNQIDNPSMTEVRGYVMLMMMRADENYTSAEGCTAEELLACTVADDIDACMAACNGNENPEEPVIVKKGTLNVSATSNDGAKIFLDGVSELDTISLKASEEINVEKVTLEKYGYTVNSGISIWLEDKNGVEITSPKPFPTNKDEITLTIKKDYRNALETKAYVVVVKVAGQTDRNVGDTLGFKVKDVTSSAETLKIASYTPATYSMVSYDSSSLRAQLKGSDDKYNIEAGEMYQVAKMRITAGTSEVSINGFTIQNESGLDLSRYVSKWEVTAGDTTLKLNTADINKNDKTVKFAFPEQTLAAKKSVDFTVKMSLVDNFDQFGEAVKFNLTGVSATETKTSARLTATGAAVAEYVFLGTQVKFTNKKLGKISAPRGKEDVVVAEGTLELVETINVDPFTITTSSGVQSLELWLNGELVDEGTPAGNAFTFNNVTFERGGKLQFVADLMTREDAASFTNTSITFTPASFNKNIFGSSATRFGTYDDSNEDVLLDSVAGSISFSNISIETAKGTLENTLTKEVEVINDEVAHTVTIFEGTYTAKKGDLYLNSGSLTLAGTMSGNDQVIATVTVGNAEFDLTFTAAGTKSDTFSNVKVNNGESVNVKIEAEVTAQSTGKLDFTLALAGEDLDDIAVDPVSEAAVSINRVANGSVTVVASSANDIVLRKNNLSLIKFTVKPKNDLTDLNRFEISGLKLGSTSLSGKVDVFVDGDKLDSDKFAIDAAGKLTISEDLEKTMDSEGVDVEVKFKAPAETDTGVVNMTLSTVNGKSINKTFKKNIVSALVKFTAQEKVGDETVYTISIEKASEEIEVTSLYYALANGITGYFVQGTVTDGTVRLLNQPNAAQYVTTISYKIDGNDNNIEKTEYEDYFRLPDESFLKAFKAD